MGIETGTYISSLVATNPVGASDPKSQGDDHIRLIKATLLNTFPNITGAVTATHTELNKLAGLTATTTELNKLAGLTATTTELNKLAGLTATTADLNTLDGADGVLDIGATTVTLTSDFSVVGGMSASGNLTVSGSLTVAGTVRSSQPAWCVSMSADKYGLGVVTFDTKLLDTANAFNTSTHAYTVPVAGVYMINASLYTMIGAKYIEARLRVNGVEKAILHAAGASDVYSDDATTTLILQLNESDVIDIYNTHAVSFVVAKSYGVTSSLFSGFLIG